jgi:hypothetical protein
MENPPDIPLTRQCAINKKLSKIETRLHMEPITASGTANVSAISLFNDVLFQADLEGPNGSTTYTEESQYTETATFNGAAQLSTTNPIYDTSSLSISSGTTNGINFPIAVENGAAWDGTGRILTAEIAFRFETLNTSLSYSDDILYVGNSDSPWFALILRYSTLASRFNFQVGFDQAFSFSPDITPSTGVDYFLAVEGDFTAGAGAGVERVWWGPISGGTVPLLNTTTNADPRSLSSSRKIYLGSSDGQPVRCSYVIDHARITNSTTGRYTTATDSITVPSVYETS